MIFQSIVVSVKNWPFLYQIFENVPVDSKIHILADLFSKNLYFAPGRFLHILQNLIFKQLKKFLGKNFETN